MKSSKNEQKCDSILEVSAPVSLLKLFRSLIIQCYSTNNFKGGKKFSTRGKKVEAVFPICCILVEINLNIFEILAGNFCFCFG